MKASVNQPRNVGFLTFLSVILFATILFGAHSVFGASLAWKKDIYGWVAGKNLALGHDNTIYVPVQTPYAPEPFKLYAFHNNGTLKWTFNTARKVTGTPSIAPDGTIYMGSQDAALYAIHPNGQELWSCPVQGDTIYGPA